MLNNLENEFKRIHKEGINPNTGKKWFLNSFKPNKTKDLTGYIFKK